MGRLGQPDEIASLVLYLLSDAGAYATGQLFIVDGGTIAKAAYCTRQPEWRSTACEQNIMVKRFSLTI